MYKSIAVFTPCCNYRNYMMTTRDVLLGDVYVLEHRIMHFYGNTKMNLQQTHDVVQVQKF